jgi:Fe-S cluster assembly protein SufD
VSQDAIFYLRSRGLSEQAARSLLVYAFARESVDQIRLEPLRAQLGDLLFARLPGGQSLREAL